MNKQYMLDRMKEPSTWIGVGAALSALGITIDVEALSAIGMGIAAILGILMKG